MRECAMHECRHPDCHRTIPLYAPACADHWLLLPAWLRRDLDAALRLDRTDRVRELLAVANDEWRRAAA